MIFATIISYEEAIFENPSDIFALESNLNKGNHFIYKY